MFYRTASPEDTFALGRALGALLESGDIVLLNGDLGTGKSVLTRGMASGCGIDGPMPSPTFTLMMAYEGRVPFYHYDLYRLDDPDQYYEAGLDEQVGGDGVAVIEWPECAELAFDDCIEVTLSRCDEGDDLRRVELTLHGLTDRREALLAAVSDWSEEDR